MNNSATVAVVAGGGDLPLKIIEKLKNLKREHVVVSIDGFGPVEYPSFKIGEIGKILDFIRSSNAAEILFCGNVKRPSFLSLKTDSVGKKWIRSLGVRAFLGDDALLKGVKKLLKIEGLSVLSPQSILDTLLTPSGLLTTQKPTELDLKDIARGLFVLNTLSKTDVGQAVVVQEGLILGIEAAEGTSELISRCKALKIAKFGGVLIKMAKINQESAIDMATIGEKTIGEAVNAGLAGIALGANNSQIIDFEKTIKFANDQKLFVIGI
ncbi:hypothetical protein FACS1894113_2040 [Alphaproteobacteria bacterium]|nr:hypothetical protein FACS1894113_2040 [Alphaproteobacteria bacterium]